MCIEDWNKNEQKVWTEKNGKQPSKKCTMIKPDKHAT